MTIVNFQVPPRAANDEERQTSFEAYRLTAETDPAFDALVEAAASEFAVPIALISIIDREHQWFKAKVGLEAPSTSRSVSFCAHAIMDDEVFIVPNALDDPRFAGNPLVIDGPRIRFYAGAPLLGSGGHKYGSLCIIDTKPRRALLPEECARLEGYAARAVDLIEHRGGWPRDADQPTCRV